MNHRITLILLSAAALLLHSGSAETTNEVTSLFGISLSSSKEQQRAADIEYQKGHNCFTAEEPDLPKAIGHYTKAAELGHPQAQFNLALCYMNGKGVDQSDTEAAKWFGLAARQGIVEALYPLGICHYNQEDYTEAYAWALFAEAKGDSRLKEMLDPMYSEEETAAGKARFEELKKAIRKTEDNADDTDE